MNAKRPAERRRPRNSGRGPTASVARRQNLPWILLSLVVLGLVLALSGYFLRPEAATSEHEEAAAAGATFDRPAPAKGETVSPELEEAPLPPVFSPGAAAEECREETKRMASELAQAFPDKLDALQTSATIHWALGDHVEAVRLWEECRVRDGEFSPAYEGLGRVSLLQGDFDRAVDMLQKAIALDPSSRHLTILLAEALLRSGQMEQVVAALASFVQSGPAPSQAFLWLGQAHLELGHSDEARRVLEIALKRMPEERQVHYALEKVYRELGQSDKAAVHRDKVRQLVEVYRKAGRGQVRESGTSDSLFRDAVRAHLDAAVVYYRYGNLNEAVMLCRKAAALDPNDVESRENLVAIYERTGRTSQAQRVRQQLRALAGDTRKGTQRP